MNSHLTVRVLHINTSDVYLSKTTDICWLRYFVNKEGVVCHLILNSICHGNKGVDRVPEF